MAKVIKPRGKRRDPLEVTMENLLQPGHFIAWNEGFSFVSELRRVEEEIGKLTGSHPARAVRLYETLVAGCYEKAEEIDDSDGEFGTFAGSLFCGWITARQAADADSRRDIQAAPGVDGRRLLRFL